MKQEEYLQTLTEQIQNKRAKKLVEEEIQNHIEEQTESYEMEGMTHEDAVEEAVRQMGNPEDTGAALNKIHRPKMPWMMIALAFGLTIISIVMQGVIFKAGTDIVLEQYNFKNTVFYNSISLLIALAVLYVDYSFIAKHAYLVYGIYLAGMTLGLIVFHGGYYQTTTLYGYGILMLYPLIFAGILYRNRNRGIKGMINSFLCSVMVLFCYWLAGNVITGSGLSIPAMSETMLIVILMLTVSIWKGIFGKEKRKYVAVLATGCGICGALGSLGLMILPQGKYFMARIHNFFEPLFPTSQYEKEMNYMVFRIRESMTDASLLGSHNFMLNHPTMENINTFLLNSIFTYFGKIAGWAVVALLVAFVVFTLWISLHQSNRISLLVGTACSMGILVRVLVYLGMNFGYSLWWTTIIPFFSYGGTGAVMNGIYVGLILSVYRNSNILKEERGGKKLKLTFEIQEE